MENKNQLNEELEVAKLFEVEELEERVEFGSWSGSAGYSESEGWHGEITYTF